MLRVKGSLCNLRLLTTSNVLPRLFSAKKSNEIVVNEVKNLTNVALKLYSRQDLVTQISFLKDLREEEINKKFVVDRFIKRNPILASTWLPNWISKAVVLEDPKDHVKLFPVAAPLDNVELATPIKLDLVNALSKIKSRELHMNFKTLTLMGQLAIPYINSLAQNMHIDHLRDITAVLENFVKGELVPSALFSELIEKGGLFADTLRPVLEFAELELSPLEEKQFLDVELARKALRDSLQEELTHFLHVIYSNRFHEASPGAKIERDALIHVPHGQKEAYQMRETRIIKISAEKDSFDYHIEHTADDGIVYSRTEQQNTSKIRFGDSGVLTVRAPCYARKKNSKKPGIYDDLNGMIADATRKDRKGRKAAKPSQKVSSLQQGEPDDEEEGREDLTHRKVVIDNLPSSITVEELRAALRNCGEVEKVWLYRDERTGPEEVRHMQMHLHSQNVMAASKRSLDQPEDSQVVDPEVEHPAWYRDDAVEDLTAKEAAVHAVQQMQLPTKHKMLRGTAKTDNYAFVQMADDRGFQRITKDSVRLFGIQVQNKSCRVLKAQTYKNFWIEVGQNHSVAEAIHSLNELFDGHFECYSDKELERMRPMYLQMTFENAAECQRAFAVLLRRMEEMKNAGIAFERRSWERRSDRKNWVHLRANLYPLWNKDSWFKEHFDRYTKYLEKKETERREQAERGTAAAASKKTAREEQGEGEESEEEEDEEEVEDPVMSGFDSDSEDEHQQESIESKSPVKGGKSKSSNSKSKKKKPAKVVK